MAEKLEDLSLPNASVSKIIKEALPESVAVGKDARSALSRAASVFVLYVTSHASGEAQQLNRKTLTGKDILTALDELGFDGFIPQLEEALKEFKEGKVKKTKPKRPNDAAAEVDKMDESTANDAI